MLILELWALAALVSLTIGTMLDEFDLGDLPFYVLAAPLVCAFFALGVAQGAWEHMRGE